MFMCFFPLLRGVPKRVHPGVSIGCCQRTTARKTPCNFNTEMFVSKVGHPYPTLGQLPTSRILYGLLVGEKQYEIARARFCTQSRSKVVQLLVNSSPTPHPMGSCRGLPCSSPLATPRLKRDRKQSNIRLSDSFRALIKLGGDFGPQKHI